MFKILVFQAATEDDFVVNMQGKDYIPFSDMEYVDYFELDNVDDTDEVLATAFSICNGSGRPEGLRYSLSIGDIVVIYDEAYRCEPVGWGKIDLSDSDYKIIQTIIKTLETENKETVNESEDNEMGKETNKEAKDVVGVVKDGLKTASEVALSLCGDVAHEAKVISAMSQTEAENHISRKFHCAADKFIDWVTNKLNIELERSETADSWFAPASGSEDSKTTSRLKKAIADFKAVKNAGEKKGWKKIKELLKAVFGIIFAVFIEVAKVVLKLAFAIAVGGIKVGACMITTLMSCAGIIKEDIVKPGAKATKKAYREFKGNKASKKGISVDDILDDDFDEDFED